MGCDEIRDLLTLFAGGETSENERIAVEAHLGLCAECRCEAEKYQETRALLAGLREGAAPAGTFERMWRRVRDEVLPRRPAFNADWLVRAAAMLVIGLTVGFLFSGERASRPADAQSTADEPRAAGNVNAPVSTADGGGGASTLGPGESFSIQVAPRPRLKAGRTLRLDGNYYLPHVEAILRADEVDF